MKDDFDDDLSFDGDVEDEFGFAPAVSATGAAVDSTTGSAVDAVVARPKRRRSMKRRIATGVVLLAALVSMGGAYAAFASTSTASDTTSSAQDIAAGKQLYDVSCITCHGANLQGVKDRGVPLIGVGGAAAYFQLSTGRMPLTGQGPESGRKTPKFTEQQIEQLAAYIESIGGGPGIPQGDLHDADIAEGGSLFRLNCASCHGATLQGAPLSAGKQAPALNRATDLQIYTAMISGPENMPIFSDNQLTPQQKRDIISYIQTLKASKDPGGHGVDRIGPVSEAVVIWVAGVGVLMIAILWIGAKNQ